MNHRSVFIHRLLVAAVAATMTASTALADHRANEEAAHVSRVERFESAKHIILFIGDGMQLEHEIAASRYLYGEDAGLSFHALPYQGNVSTWDVTTYNKWAEALGRAAYDPTAIVPSVGYDPTRGGELPYPLQTEIDDEYFIPADGSKPFATDSASAATAWATGHKTEDGNIAWLPGDPVDGSLRTIAELLRDQKGFAIGVVSTVPFTHATPAAHVSHNVNRNDYFGIGAEILEVVKPEVVIGGGYPGPEGTNGFRYLSEATYEAVKADAEYLVVERQAGVDGSVSVLEAADLAAADGRKLFGLYGGPGGNFDSPVPYDLPGTPLIEESSDENPLLKDATLAALKVLSQDGDGFFVVIEQGDIDWANHANDFARMVGTIWDLHEAVQTAIDYVNRPGDGMDWGNTLLLVMSDHSNSYMRLNPAMPLGAGDLPTQLIATYPDGEVSYSTRKHTNELARIYAQGAGAWRLKAAEGDWYPCTRIIDNTQLFHVMAAASGADQDSALALAKRVKRRCQDTLPGRR